MTQQIPRQIGDIVLSSKQEGRWEVIDQHCMRMPDMITVLTLRNVVTHEICALPEDQTYTTTSLSMENDIGRRADKRAIVDWLNKQKHEG